MQSDGAREGAGGPGRPLGPVERALARVSLFKAVQYRAEASEVRKGAHQTAVFVVLMAVALGVLLSRVSTEETVRVVVDRPTLAEYRADLAARKPDCPCTNRAIERRSFVTTVQEPNPYVKEWSDLCGADSVCASAPLDRSLDAIGPVHLAGVQGLYTALWLFAVRFDTAERAAVAQLDAIVYRDHDLIHESDIDSRVQGEDGPIRGQLIGATRHLAAVLLSFVAVGGGVPVYELAADSGDLSLSVSAALCAGNPLSCNALAIMFFASAAELNDITATVFSNATLLSQALVNGTDLGYADFINGREYISTSADYAVYYEQCAPSRCEYVVTRGRSTADMASTLLGVLGGLVVFVRLFVDALFALPPISSRYDPSQRPGPAKHGTMLSSL